MGLRIRRGSSAKLGIVVTLFAGFALAAQPAYSLLSMQMVSALTDSLALDTTPPTVEVITPEGNLQKNLKIHVKVTDEHLSNVKFTVKRMSDGATVNVKAATPDEGVKTLELEDYDLCANDRLKECDDSWVTDGEYQIRVLAYTSEGPSNVSTYRKVVVDTELPEVTFTAPANGSVGETLVIGAELKDNKALAQYGFDVSGPDGVKFSTKNFQTTAKEVLLHNFDLCAEAYYGTCPVELPDGAYVVRAKVYDQASNREITKTLQLVVDRKAPIITMGAIAATFSGTAVISGQASDAGSGLETSGGNPIIHLTFYDAANNTKHFKVPVTGGQWSFELNTKTDGFFEDGYYKVVAHAYDGYGRESFVTKYFSVDNTAPATSMRLTSRPTMMASTGPITLAGKVNESLRTLLLKNLRTGDEVELKDRVDSAGNWTYTIPTEKIEAGEYSFSLYAEDQYGNGRTTNLGPVMVTQYVPSNGGITPASPDSGSVTLASPNLFTTPATVPFTAVQQDDEADESEVLGAQAAKQPTQSSDLPAVAATESGWKVFGIAWYWWALIAAILAAGAWWTVASVRRRRVTELA